MDDHVAIYGSKLAEGLSAFQRRSCLIIAVMLACFHSFGKVLMAKEVLNIYDRGTATDSAISCITLGWMHGVWARGYIRF